MFTGLHVATVPVAVRVQSTHPAPVQAKQCHFQSRGLAGCSFWLSLCLSASGAVSGAVSGGHRSIPILGVCRSFTLVLGTKAVGGSIPILRDNFMCALEKLSIRLWHRRVYNDPHPSTFAYVAVNLGHV
jgi:hypothetical protein